MTPEESAYYRPELQHLEDGIRQNMFGPSLVGDHAKGLSYLEYLQNFGQWTVGLDYAMGHTTRGGGMLPGYKRSTTTPEGWEIPEE